MTPSEELAEMDAWGCDWEKAEKLLEAGADVETKLRGNMTLLLSAVYCGMYDKARMLVLKYNANVDQDFISYEKPKPVSYFTALSLVVTADPPQDDLIELFLERGAKDRLTWDHHGSFLDTGYNYCAKMGRHEMAAKLGKHYGPPRAFP